MRSLWSPLRTAGRLGGFAVLAFLSMLALATPPANGAADRWNTLGPEGGEVLSLLTHPTDAQVVYAGMLGGGVFVSRNGGSRWVLAGEGMLATRVDALAMADFPGAPLYAGTDHGVFRLEDGAETWRHISRGLPFGETVGSIVVDPADPSTLFAIVAREPTSGTWSVYRSRNGGDRWSNVSRSGIFLPSLAVAATSPTSIYVGSFDGIYRSQDDGVSWTRFADGLPSRSPVNDILVDPANPAILYSAVRSFVGDNDSAVYKSVDGGVRWEKRGEGLPNPFGSPNALAILPGRPGTLYLGNNAGVYRSIDGAASWQAVNAPPADLPIQTLAVQPANGALYAGGSRFGGQPDALGVLRSRDAGESWSSQTAGLKASFISSVSPDPGIADRVIISTERKGMLASDDGGASWRPSGIGIQEPLVGPLTRDPHAPELLYTVAGDSRFVLDQVYRSTDSGSNWEALGTPFEEGVGPVVVDAIDPSVLYLAGDQRIYRSTTGGSQWSDVSGVICAGNLTVGGHPFRGGRLLAGCVEDSGAPVSPPVYVSFLLLSSDEGFTWQRVLEGPSGAISGEWFFSAGRTLVDDRAPQTLFAGLTGYTYGGAYRSENDGESWVEIEGLANAPVEALVTDPSPPTLGRLAHAIFAATADNGVLRSVDNGLTWTPFNTGLTGANVKALAFDPRKPERVWAGTLGAGVHMVDPVSRASCVPTEAAPCLLNRFLVRVDWQVDASTIGAGVPLPPQEGTLPAHRTTSVFWFFNPNNPEVAVKVLDGRAVNGHFWVFHSGLSTVGYSITVTDMATGVSRVYGNPAGSLTSAGDVRAFPEDVGTASAAISLGSEGGPGLDPAGDGANAAVNLAEGSSLLLLNDRFQVDVQWFRGPSGNGSRMGPGTGVPLTPQSGAFWFFRPQNLEVFVKILDGRRVNGHHWLFFGTLSNLAFELTVTDTETGQRRTYTHPAGNFGSVVDTMVF